ncbi:BMP family protein [Anaerolineales bacterium HSG25]|nr:BMP family protein [Anaerolineales bacterium HSG25]
MKIQLLKLCVLFFAILLFAAQCNNTTPEAKEDATSFDKTFKMAAIFPGVITDADYNTLGYIGLTSVQSDLGVETVYSESVAVPDVEQIIRKYIDDGFNIIFTHGGQFLSQTKALAEKFPNVYFIGESDTIMEDMPENLWVIGRNFHVSFYPLGALAAAQTKTGKIGYIGGLPLPFSYAEVHAIKQAIADAGADVELVPVWTGDFNDPTKAREVADILIADDDVDVIIGSLNLGMFGLFEAVKASDKHVLATAKYTDKSNFAPNNYITSVLYDFSGPLTEIVQKIQTGEGGGYYPLGFDTGVAMQMPLKNADDGVEATVKQVISDVESGKAKVRKDVTPH